MIAGGKRHDNRCKWFRFMIFMLGDAEVEMVAFCPGDPKLGSRLDDQWMHLLSEEEEWNARPVNKYVRFRASEA